MEMELDTPGTGNRCLYFAVAMALGSDSDRISAESIRLKALAHATAAEMATTTPLPYLLEVLRLTRAGTRELASDHVVSVLARAIGKIIVVIEDGVPIEFDPPGAVSRIEIGHSNYHFFAIRPTLFGALVQP